MRSRAPGTLFRTLNNYERLSCGTSLAICPPVLRRTLAALLLFSLPAAAEPPPPALGIREAIALAARNNPTLAASVADVTIADANVLAAQGADDFLWDASAGYTRTRREVVPGTPVQQPKGDDVLLSTALTRPLPTGGKVGLRLSAELLRGEYMTDVGAGPESAPFESKIPAVQLFASHPLLRGAGVDVARAHRRRARAARDVAGLTRDATAAVIVRDVVVSYWEARLAAEEVEIRRALTESARQQLAAVQAAIDVQKQPPSATAEVKVAVAFREDEAIAAEETMRAQSIELARLLGLDLDARAASLQMTDKPGAIAEGVSFDAALSAAMQNNPALAAVRAKGRAATIEIDVAENGTLPALDLAVLGGTRGGASEADAALRQLVGGRSYDLQLALVFQEPLGRHTARGALAAAQTELHKAKLTEADVTAQIRSAVLRQIGAMDAARQRSAALATTIDTASLDLAAERARFEVGRATNFDVLRRQDELAQAQSRSLRARVDYLRAAAGLETLTGDILAHYGVTVR
jgi:outer membrane protein